MAEERGSATGTPVLSEWLGYWVFITYTSGPNLDQSEPTKLVKGQPEAITASFFLENYGPLGIEVRRTTETPTIFMSWGAVLYIQGPPPEVRKQIDKEVSKRTGEAGPTPESGTGVRHSHRPRFGGSPVIDGAARDSRGSATSTVLRRLCYEAERTTLRALVLASENTS